MAIVLASTQVILRTVIHRSLKIMMSWLIGQDGFLVYAVDAFQITKFMENLSLLKVHLQTGLLDALAKT